MRKIIYSALLSVSLFGMEYTNDSLDTWRDGFITAYKALKVDTKVQGVNSKLIDTKDYIIYFDANAQDISDWDKLMVQMFGYSSSIHKPIRSVENYIIFDSYDNKATALQEMEILNTKIFKNSEKYKLKLFDNSASKRKFYNDRALLMDELKDLENLLKEVNRIKLTQKEKELEDNQKVALVYVDNSTNKVIPTPTVIVEEPQKNVVVKELKNKNTSSNKTNVFSDEIFFGESIKSVPVFKRPYYNSKNKLYTLAPGKTLEFEGKNDFGWFKIKNKNEYVAGHLFKIVSKSISENNITKVEKQQIASKNPVIVEKKIDLNNKLVETKKIEEVIAKDNHFTLVDNETVLYKLDSFSISNKTYSVSEFIPTGIMKNDYKEHPYTNIVKDTDGNKYLKLKNMNALIEMRSAYIVN